MPNPFKMKVDCAASKTFGLPLSSPGETYNCTVAWGDGNIDIYTTSGTKTHTYADYGTYTIEITENVSGGFPGIYFNAAGDRLKVLEIVAWGTNKWKTFKKAFTSCENLTITATDHLTADTGGVTDTTSAWEDCYSLTSFPLIDTSNVTDFTRTWSGCLLLASFPLINTGKGIYFDLTWEACSALTNFPLINTSNGFSFYGTWRYCEGLTSFPLIDTSNGEEFYATWNGCIGLTSIPLLNMRKMNWGGSQFADVTLSTSSYSALLIDLNTYNVNDSVDFDGGNSKYNSGAVSARDNLINVKNWTITDGGLAASKATFMPFYQTMLVK